MKLRMKSIPASIVGYVALIVILTAGAAQSLAGTNTVDSGDIIDGTITTPDLQTGAVSSAKILNNSILAGDIAANGVGASEITAAAVGASEVATGAIVAGKIGPNAISSPEIADDAIGSTEITANAITNAKMATDSVASNEITLDAVGSAEIAADAVGSSEIATSAVGSAEVNNRTLTLDDFATAEDANITTTTSINANTCVTIATGLSGAAVGDLPIVVLRSATAGTFWEGLRVTTAGQFPLRACNTTDGNLASATSTIDVFTVRP